MGEPREALCSHHDEDRDDATLGRTQRPAPQAELGDHIRPPQARYKHRAGAGFAAATLHSILEMEVQQPEFSRSATAADREPFLRNRIELLPGSDNDLREYMRRPLWVLLALTAAAVLLLACANLANLLLARATTREKEFAVRLAIGAWTRPHRSPTAGRKPASLRRWCRCGVMLAYAADRILLGIYLPADAAAEFVVSPIPDGRMLAFTLGVMLLTSLVFGLLPAMRASHTEITVALKDRSGAASAGGMSLRRLLVSIQMALSLLLLVGAGLFVRTLRNLENVGAGFPNRSSAYIHNCTHAQRILPSQKRSHTTTASKAISKRCPELLRLHSPPCRF